MCGIVGQLGEAGSITAAAVVAARDTLVHRGPDDAGVYVSGDGSVGLGHRRLSIIDLSAAARQPMANRSGRVRLIFNGEIYNFRGLRAELECRGHAFASASDSEVILHAYEEWGASCVARLEGMFAFAVWDERRRALLLARDRLGIKPLYYWHDGPRLSFASELRAVMADRRVPRGLDETAIYDFFTYQYVPTPKSIFAAVRKLAPGHYAWFEDGRLRLEEYWDVDPAPLRLSAAEARAGLLEHLQRAVREHLVADVPVGVMLSGGVDSSAVAAFASQETAPHLRTFTIGFDVAAHSEAAHARAVATTLGTDHHELVVTEPMALALVPRVIDLYDEPYADGSAIPTLLVSELARRTVKVALSGEGGDEVFAGYHAYAHWLRYQGGTGARSPVVRGACGLLGRLLPRGARGQRRLAMMGADPLRCYAQLMGAFLVEEKRALLAPRFLARFRDYDELWQFRRYWRPDLDPLLRMQVLDLKTYLPDDLLTKFDRATMAVSLEGRVPLLDHALLEFVLGLPAEVRNPRRQLKHLLKAAIADRLPGEVVRRPKRGFSVPWYGWLRDREWELAEPVDEIFRPDLAASLSAFSREDQWRAVVMNTWLVRHAAG